MKKEKQEEEKPTRENSKINWQSYEYEEEYY